MTELYAQSVSDIRALRFLNLKQLDNAGTFEIEFEVPDQYSDIPGVIISSGRRFYAVRLWLDGSKIHEANYLEQSINKVQFTYTSASQVVLMGQVGSGDGKWSDRQDCRYMVRFLATNFIISFEGCDNAQVSECSIEGEYGGILVQESSLLLSDCEIILTTDDPNPKFVIYDAESSVIEQNVRKIRRSS